MSFTGFGKWGFFVLFFILGFLGHYFFKHLFGAKNTFSPLFFCSFLSRTPIMTILHVWYYPTNSWHFIFFSGQKTVFSIGLLGVLHYTTAAVCPLEKAINVGNLPHVGHFFKILTLFQSLPVLENFPELSSGCFGIISRVYRCYRGRWVC